MFHATKEEVVHVSLSVIAMCADKSIVFLNLSSTYMGVVMEHFKSLLLAFGKVCDAF